MDTPGWFGVAAKNLSTAEHPIWGVAKLCGIAVVVFVLNFADAETWTLADEGLWSMLTTVGVGGIVGRSLFR